MQKFVDEMGDIGEAVKAYKQKWYSGDVIKQNASDFISETKKLFTALSQRIEKENNVLYKAFDEI